MNKEVLKCLKCKNAKCTQACPISTPVAEVMTLYQANKKPEAAKMLFENNPFAYVCSLVCNYEEQCYGNCILQYKNVPVKFYEVEEELSKEYLENVNFEVNIDKNQKIAVIGAGPAGITVAIRLASAGYKTTIFDKFEEIGGVLKYGIPENRLPKNILDNYVRILKQLHVEFKGGCEIGSDYSVEQLSKEYDAVCVAIGAWVPKAITISDAKKNNVINAIDYLKSPHDFDLGQKVVVIGAGNVAMDSAYTAKLYGYDTYVYYRKTAKQMPASEKEVKLVEDIGVEFKFLNVPNEIVDEGIYFDDGEVVEENGKIKTKIIPNTKHFVACDSIIVAISQKCDINFLKNANIKITNNKTIATNGNLQTNLKNIFAAGDVVNGPDTVVSAVNQAKLAADSIIDYLDDELTLND